MTEEHKIIMEPEIPIMSWVMLEKHFNEEGSAHKSSIIKWKWFKLECAARGMQVFPLSDMKSGITPAGGGH